MIITKETFIIADTHFGHKNILKHETIQADVGEQS